VTATPIDHVRTARINVCTGTRTAVRLSKEPRHLIYAANSWQTGYVAGASGEGPQFSQEVADRLAYAAGFIEGNAARHKVQRALAAIEGRQMNDEPGDATFNRLDR
jgi:hypothetical protein